MTIAWAPCPGTNPPQFYVLELDDGTGNGNFRQVTGERGREGGEEEGEGEGEEEGERER